MSEPARAIAATGVPTAPPAVPRARDVPESVPVAGPDPLGDAVARLRAVLDVSRALAVVDDEDELLELVASAAVHSLGYGACVVAVRSDDGTYHTRACVGVPPEADAQLRSTPLPAEVYERLAAAATAYGRVRLVPAGHPVLDTAAVSPYLVKTTPAGERRHRQDGSVLFVPLTDFDGQQVGFLSPDRPVSGQAPTEAQVVLLETFAHQAAIALHLSRARRAKRFTDYLAETQKRQLEGLLRAAATVRGALRLDDVLQEIATAMTGSSGFRRVAIYLADGAGLLHVRGVGGLPAADAERLREVPVPRAEFRPLMQPQMRVSRSYLFDHRRDELPPELLDRLSVPANDATWVDGRWHPLDSLTVPLCDADGRELGLISADEPWDGRFPDRSRIEALEFFADQCAVAIRQARHAERLEELARTDPLTGVPNRRGIRDVLDQVFAAAGRSGRECALLFCDLDHFKEINDGFGHQTGDAMLQLLADTLRDRVRSGDVVGRYGGEEFVVLLPDTSLDGALALAETLRDGVSRLTVPGAPAHPLRVSIGVATSAAATTVDELIAAADAAVYAAKHGGRNRVCAHTSSTTGMIIGRRR